MNKLFSVLLLSSVISVSALAQSQGLEQRKAQVFDQLSMLSSDVDLGELREVSTKITTAEMDLVFFRLQKEIEKVPDLDLSQENRYDMRLIQELVDIVHRRTSEDNFEAINKIKNLAGRRLYPFELYTDLLVYQLDAAALRANINLTSDPGLSKKLSIRLSLTESFVRDMKQETLSKDHSKSVASRLEYASICSTLF